MPIEIFNDSRGFSHSIYMQEKYTSCGIACIATIINLVSGYKLLEEAHLRLVSQKFPYGYYRPHPLEVNADQRTFIADLIEKQPINSPSPSFFQPNAADETPFGVSGMVISKTLALYNLYSNKQVLNELNTIKSLDDMGKLRSKIILLGVKTFNDSDHAVILRDIWEDGTFIVYAPALGLVETKEIERYYNFFPDSNSLAYAYAVSHSEKKELDLEAANFDPKHNEVLAADDSQFSLPSAFL